ncbi:MAG: Gfo/Idh/MocA family oxidoreductase [Clostridia bacterium]|nr:Gfo/Idh/MocA family oxidoreductase [Clostridia bacterium]
MSKKVKIGVIGAGGIAKNVHLPSLSEIEDCEIVAICDLYEDKAKTLADKYGIKKTYALHHEMIEKEELDGVFVLVNPDRTYWVADTCLKAGLNVIMEKPAGINSYQAHSLARTAEEMGKIAAVAMNRRHIPIVQETLKRVKAVTEITEIDSRFMKYSSIHSDWHYADAYMCDIIHALDLLRYAAGSEPKDVATVVQSNNAPVDNAWCSIVRFENGIIGTLRANYQTAARFHDFEIHGPNASAYINLGFGNMKCGAEIHYNTGGSMYSAASAGVQESRIEYLDAVEFAGSDKNSHYYGYKAEDVDFINCLLNGTKPLCTIEDAAKSMDMAELLLKKRI